MGKDKKKANWIERLKNRYRIAIMNADTFEEKGSFNLSRFDLYILLSTFIILIAVIVISTIIFTPLKQYLLGYNEVILKNELIDLRLEIDSLEDNVMTKDLYIKNIKNVIAGKIDTIIKDQISSDILYDNIQIGKTSKYDSIFNERMEKEDSYSLISIESVINKKGDMTGFHFFAPIKGFITNEFNVEMEHFGVDVVAPENTIVKATMDGIIILETWTLETGYIVAIQHKNDIISFYKHNSAVLKKIGNFVKAGDVIAIIGNTGEITTGTHLHFELWYKGLALNPSEYMIFN